jgi:hypothetical protein
LSAAGGVCNSQRAGKKDDNGRSGGIDGGSDSGAVIFEESAKANLNNDGGTVGLDAERGEHARAKL